MLFEFHGPVSSNKLGNVAKSLQQLLLMYLEPEGLSPFLKEDFTTTA